MNRIIVLILAFYSMIGMYAQTDNIVRKRAERKTSIENSVLQKTELRTNGERSGTISSTNHAKQIVSVTYSNGELKVGEVSYRMIYIEGDNFIMGATPEIKSFSDDEKPTHQVNLSNYLMGQTEVTQALWKSVMGNNPSEFKGDNRPVENVSWDDCQQFISKLNKMTGQKFRLPTEAEWEFAARGGKKSNHYQFSGSNEIDEVAWYFYNSEESTHNVAMKRPNELGIYDMSGNVSEWCYDWYGEYSGNFQTNPEGPTNGKYRVYRGGDFQCVDRGCHSASRLRNYPQFGVFSRGFRLALSK